MSTEDGPKVVDVFCGAGGLSAGFRKAGFNIVLGVDQNKHSIDTFKANHSCETLLADVRAESIVDDISNSIRGNGHDPHDINVVIGGPPCRGFSLANVKSRSADNPLNELPKKFIDIVERLHPDVVLMENVPKLLSMDDGKFKNSIQSAFQKLGYRTDHKILNAVDFGVPQRRRRVFFFGLKSSKPAWPSPGDYDYPTPVSVGAAISDLPPLPTGGGGKTSMKYEQNKTDVSEYAISMRPDEQEDDLWNHRTTVNRQETYRRFSHIPQGGNWKDIPKNLMKNYSDRERTHDHIYQRLEEDKPSKTVANFRKQMIVHPTQDRLLSVREAARLQSFPDRYHFKGESFNARQQMVGDAVPVNLALSLAKEIRSSLATCGSPRSNY